MSAVSIPILTGGDRRIEKTGEEMGGISGKERSGE